MKILQIIPNLRKGGAERLVLDICKELQNRVNIQIKLVTFSDINEYQEPSASIDWKVIPSKFIPSITGKPIKKINELQEFVSSYKPDIIHTHLWEAEIVSRQIDYTEAKWFSHFHDNMFQLRAWPWPIAKTSITSYYERHIMLNRYKTLNNHFICIANHSMHYAKQNLPNFFIQNCTLLQNAINIKQFASKESFIKDNLILKLVTVGSLVAKKNQQFLIKVVQLLKKKEPTVHLDILGDGPNFQSLKKQIKDLNLAESITIHGNVNKVEEFLWQSSVYVHSAVYEPFGLVLIEAMAAGLPIVTLNGGGNADIMENEKNGFILNEANPELFAEKILEIWQNKPLYTEMSNYAQEYAKQYDIKGYCCKLLEIYKNA